MECCYQSKDSPEWPVYMSLSLFYWVEQEHMPQEVFLQNIIQGVNTLWYIINIYIDNKEWLRIGHQLPDEPRCLAIY